MANPRTNPFLIYNPLPDPEPMNTPKEFQNPIAVFYEEFAPPVLPRPQATRTPLKPVTQTSWDPSQGMKGAKTSTFVPLPIPGTTPTTESEARVAKGKDGMNTMINLIVDVSGSMNDTAAVLNGEKYSRSDVARICAIICIEMAKRGDDFFGMYSFGKYGKTVWPSPSLDHQDAIDWMKGYYPPQVANMDIKTPFAAIEKATHPEQGMRECIRDMKAKKMDQSVTIIICDEWGGGASKLYNAAMSDDGFGGTCDATLRKYGPVFYIGIGPEDLETEIDKNMEEFSKKLDRVVGYRINPPPGISAALGTNNKGAVSLMAAIARMCQMV